MSVTDLRSLRIGLAGLALAVSAGTARGAGYAVNEQGAAALGVAGAVTATAGDPSAIYYNPAGLARLQGTQLMAGVSPTVRRVDFAGTAPFPGYDVGGRWADDLLLPPHAYVSRPVARGITGGIGFYMPFALDAKWRDPDGFAGRYISTRTRIRATYLTPALAVELTPSLSLGVGASVVLADAALDRRLPVALYQNGGLDTEDVAELRFDGDPTTGFTFSAGLIYDIGRWHVGVTYRHGLTVDVDGNADVRFLSTGDASQDSVLMLDVPGDQSASAEVPFPASASFGLAYELSDGARVEVDLSWAAWSAVDELPLTFADGAPDVRLLEDFDDVLGVRVGLSARASEKLTFRGGYSFEDTPVPSHVTGPVLPGARQHALTFGVGYAYEGWRLDLFQMLGLYETREIRDNQYDFNGDYAQGAWVSGVSVSHAIW